MNSIDLGGSINRLRKAKGITQETLAEAMGVSTQAVSKWENGVSYPDMSMIPMIAGYFEVSLDTLFDYDIRRVKSHIQKVLEQAKEYFFDDPQRYAQTVRAALAENPDNEELLWALLDGYEYTLRNFDEREHLDEMTDIAYKLINSSRDFVKICDAKDVLSAVYLKKGSYDKAVEILDSLPRFVELRDQSKAFRLSGEDKREAAEKALRINIQELYISCHLLGEACWKSGQWRDALSAYEKGLAVLETFMVPGGEAEEAYLWRGMQTFHWGFHMWRAGCLKKLGRTGEAAAEVAEAYRIIRTAWSDFEEKTEYYMECFYENLQEFELEEYRQ